ncbi:MAG: PorV/PorQ family protein [Ignavibacteria bacterium]|nr:PorV/PorQ family protein [Ignavibacteria bacterium]
MKNLFSTKFIFFFLAFLSILNFKLYSQISGGGYSGSYLFKETGSRAISFAGAYTAVSNDPNTIFYNPAGFSSCAPTPMIFFSYSLLEFNRSFANIAFAQSFENFGIGASISTFKSGNIIGRNRYGYPIGNFTDYFFNISFGASYSTNFANFGFVAKYLNNTLQGSGISANGFSLDFGSKFNVLDLFNFGIAIQNIGGFLKYNTREEKSTIPFVIRTGIATEFPLSQPKTITFINEIGMVDSLVQPPPEYILVSFDVNYIQFQKYPNFILALEIVPYEIISLRGGLAIAGNKDGKFSFLPLTLWGAGISIKPNIADFYNLFSIDFSFGNDLIADKKLFYTIGIGIQF